MEGYYPVITKETSVLNRQLMVPTKFARICFRGNYKEEKYICSKRCEKSVGIYMYIVRANDNTVASPFSSVTYYMPAGRDIGLDKCIPR